MNNYQRSVLDDYLAKEAGACIKKALPLRRNVQPTVLHYHAEVLRDLECYELALEKVVFHDWTLKDGNYLRHERLLRLNLGYQVLVMIWAAVYADQSSPDNELTAYSMAHDLAK